MNRPVDEFVASFVGMENIFSGKVTASREGLLTVTVMGCTVEIHGSAREGEEAVFCVRPEHITIISDQGGATSARNVFPAVINKIVSMGVYYKLHLDCGIPLVASLTLQSLSELRLEKGQRVIASFKATSVHLIRTGS
jgi:tungstate transport system ATP-binding protein